MHAIRQKCRPKHQVLILKCYPRTTKGAVDVKPNSSELSYLLYYATTRRSKIQKVGAFLEKKTASDVWHARIGNVQVTLQILAALIEKSPRDLPLYAPHLLKILSLVQRSRDITMVEATLPTFEAFCDHHDGASLSADQAYMLGYKEIVDVYATMASTRIPASKTTPSPVLAMRWRSVGLQAINSVASSDALASVTGRQLDTIMPVLLENIWTDNDDFLEVLLQKTNTSEKVDGERQLPRRRASAATVRTMEESGDTNPLALAGSVADVDKLAEEDIGVLALQCLKKVFTVNNRAQIRSATINTLQFIKERVSQNEIITLTHKVPSTGEDGGWAIKVFEMISYWTPVQDRYVILVTAMDQLVRSPLTEEDLPRQIVLTTMVGWLLRSNINLIGLSVMDVLLGLIQHVLRTLQLGVKPHPQQSNITDENSPSLSKDPSPDGNDSGAALVGQVATPSPARIELLSRLQQCIADIATHIYYADQISDMISTILMRLKPSPLSPVPNTAAAIENPEATSNALSVSGNLQEDSRTDDFFSFSTAKVTALKAIKGILLVARNRSREVGAASLGRNRVGAKVWEGTQWLLRDTDGDVRKCYVDALLCWVDCELTKADLRAFEDSSLSPRGSKRNDRDASPNPSKRATLNATNKDKASRADKSKFIQLLHLAIYENALQYAQSENDIVLLHLLLTTFAKKLGINAVKHGLPMVFRLQEDIQEVETPMSKIRLGSLCHGYYWALSDYFDFETTSIGREIQQEIRRRRTADLWVEMIQVPPMPLDRIGTPGESTTPRDIPYSKAESESLSPFDSQMVMVDCIAAAYAATTLSPPGSPPASPGRTSSQPMFFFDHTNVANPEGDDKMPEKVRDQMLAEWNKESIIASVQEGSNTASLNGSKAGTAAAGHRNFLAVSGSLRNGNGNGTTSGTQSPQHAPHTSRSRSASQGYGLVGGLSSIARHRKASAPDGSPSRGSDSTNNHVARIDHMKRVLSGQAPPSRGRVFSHSNASSESMVSYDFTPSEASFNPPNGTDLARFGFNDPARSRSRDRDTVNSHDPLGSNPTSPSTEKGSEQPEEEEKRDKVPPVPPIPSSMGSSQQPAMSGNQRPRTAVDTPPERDSRSMRRSVRNRGRGTSAVSKRYSFSSGVEPAVVDLETLLNSIDPECPPTFGVVTSPPV